MNADKTNYDRLRQDSAALFKSLDMEQVIAGWKPECDGEAIYSDYLGEHFRIFLDDGHCEVMKEDWETADVGDSMVLYDIFSHDSSLCIPSGVYTPMQNLSSVVSTASYAGKGMFAPYEEYFDGKTEAFKEACRKMGGSENGKGDAGFTVPVFRDLCVRLEFWNSDDEFPASLVLMADKNTLHYMHYETVWYVVSGLLHRLKQLV